LVDSSVWVGHLRRADPALSALLVAGQVLCHPFVIGELAVGNLKNRVAVLADLSGLQSAEVATDGEALRLIDQRRLHGLGVGYVDVHLLAATLLTSGATLWTTDNRLQQVAGRLGLAAVT
jgi:predicted nucleic acid-binding protein